MRTGACTITTGLYQSDCECRIQCPIRRGDDAPICPSCHLPVEWMFLRSTHIRGLVEPAPTGPQQREEKTSH